ncbi:MAG: acyltransferase [Leptospiraceae bacterium]|nr:acyltransferase [Leptospiraceae bacterium]
MGRSRSDLLRLLSMGMVLAIHATGFYEHSFVRQHDYLSQDFLAVLLNQLARFSVPVFVTLSGFGLTRKYMESARNGGAIRIPLASFYKHRLYKIGLPFLFYTILYLCLQGQIQKAFAEENVWELIPYFYRKGADYHFYFFHIIFECYAVYPFLLLGLFRLSHRWRWVALFLSFLAQLYVSSPAHIWLSDWPRPPFLFSAFILYWQFPLILGIVTALNPLPAKKAVGRAMLAATIFAFGLVLFDYLFWSYRSGEPGDFNHFTRMSVMIFAALFFWTFAAWPDSEKDRPWIGYAAGLSFHVYIVHTWFLRGLEILLPRNVLLVLGSLILVSFLWAMLLDRMLTWPWLRNLLGLEAKRSALPG